MEAIFEQCIFDSKHLNSLNSRPPKQAAAKSAE